VSEDLKKIFFCYSELSPICLATLSLRINFPVSHSKNINKFMKILFMDDGMTKKKNAHSKKKSLLLLKKKMKKEEKRMYNEIITN
jgi:hypothetical protein